MQNPLTSAYCFQQLQIIGMEKINKNGLRTEYPGSLMFINIPDGNDRL